VKQPPCPHFRLLPASACPRAVADLLVSPPSTARFTTTGENTLEPGRAQGAAGAAGRRRNRLRKRSLGSSWLSAAPVTASRFRPMTISDQPGRAAFGCHHSGRREQRQPGAVYGLCWKRRVSSRSISLKRPFSSWPMTPRNSMSCRQEDARPLHGTSPWQRRKAPRPGPGQSSARYSRNSGKSLR